MFTADGQQPLLRCIGQRRIDIDAQRTAGIEGNGG